MGNPDMPKREGYLKHPEWLNSDIKALGEKGSTLGRLVTEGMPELLLGEEGTIPWYMSLAPGADLTDKVMEGRRPGLLDMPGLGTLGKFAMLPIAKFGAKEIRSGAARMGKSSRNIEKANQDDIFIRRFHRTPAENEASIDQQGLRIMNSNRGANTRDIDKYIPVNFLGTSSVNIPVLRRLENTPNKFVTYEVNIPKEEYYNTPRVMFEGGRGGSPKIVKAGESSLTDEGEYKIDTFGKDIPPEWLRKIPNSEIDEKLRLQDSDRDLRELIVYGPDEETGNEVYGNAISKLGSDNNKMYKRHLADFGMLTKSGDMPPWDLEGLDDALKYEGVTPHRDSEGLRAFKDYITIGDRVKSNKKLLDDAFESYNNRYKDYTGDKRVNANPSAILGSLLKDLPVNLREYYKPGAIPGFDTPDATVRMPKRNAIGSISRGQDVIGRRSLLHMMMDNYRRMDDANPDKELLRARIKDWIRNGTKQ